MWPEGSGIQTTKPAVCAFQLVVEVAEMVLVVIATVLVVVVIAVALDSLIVEVLLWWKPTLVVVIILVQCSCGHEKREKLVILVEEGGDKYNLKTAFSWQGKREMTGLTGE